MLTQIIAELRKRGYMGVAFIDQGGGNYLAGSVSASGGFTDPRSWETHSTPEAALADLGRQLGVTDPCHDRQLKLTAHEQVAH